MPFKRICDIKGLLKDITQWIGNKVVHFLFCPRERDRNYFYLIFLMRVFYAATFAVLVHQMSHFQIYLGVGGGVMLLAGKHFKGIPAL